MRRFGLALALLLAVNGFVTSRAADDLCAPSFCERHTAMVSMSYEVSLDASLYLPVEGIRLPLAGGLPLIVRQHGGGSNKDSAYDVKWGLEYVKTGKFALLTYSHRGHGNSGGVFDFFGERTTLDFSEMLDWVEAEFGDIVDTGNVGVNGYSQGGGESLLPAENDSRVKAAAVGNTFDNLNHALNPNDCYKFSFATGIFALAYKTSASDTQDDVAVRWGTQWMTDTEDQPLGAFSSTTDEADRRSPDHYLNGNPHGGAMYQVGLHIPVFWSNSWEDQLFPADHGLEILRHLKSEGHPVHYWFASGGHAAGPNDVDDEASKEAAMREWMEEFLRGVDHGFASGARPEVDYAQRQNVFWAEQVQKWDHFTAPSWPAHSTTQSFFAWPDGTLKTGAYSGDQHLGVIVNDLASANVANDAISHEVPRQIDDGIRNNFGQDPELRELPNLVPESVNPADTATFTTAPWTFLLGDAHTYVGAPTVSIPYRTTAKQVLQLNVKLWDLAGDHRKLIWRGCTSIASPGETGTALVTLWPNAHKIGQFGNRLSLTISAVDFPTFKPDTEPHATVLLPGVEVRLPRRS